MSIWRSGTTRNGTSCFSLYTLNLNRELTTLGLDLELEVLASRRDSDGDTLASHRDCVLGLVL